MKKLLKYAACLVFMVAALTLAGYSALDLVPDPLAGGRPGYAPSIRVEDREGRLLREFLSGRETRSRWAGLDELGPYLPAAAISVEDKRFRFHPGVDPIAVMRAAFQNVRNGRVVSGASTITMQLARLLSPGPRTFRQKIREAVMALRIEKTYSKDRIMEEYLNRAPCGNLTYGLPAAARLYFQKNTKGLSPAEAAFLMALPQSPGRLNPFHNADAAIERRNMILSRMAEQGYITKDQADRGRAEGSDLNRLARFRAPHFTNHVQTVLGENLSPGVRTTLDLEIQTQVERLTKQTVEKARKENTLSQAAVLVMALPSREILAWVGSADFFDPKDGQNDGVLAQRQPGSTVKPFTYATALDLGATPADMISDSRAEYGLKRGVYTPSNYNDRFHGDVTLRTALASSLNVPAVKLLDKVGPAAVHRRMLAAGLKSLTREPDYYGLGLTLGSGEVSLLELATAYATLADGGNYVPPVFLKSGVGQNKQQRVFSNRAAYMITNILSDDSARATGFGRDSLLSLPFPAAAKTGTSKNFRDNWCVGYTDKFVVAVWAGNFDARPMGRVSGITGAGPLWRKVMRLMAGHLPAGDFKRPEGLIEEAVCAETGLRATENCPNQFLELFMEDRPAKRLCDRHRPETVQAQHTIDDKDKNHFAILHPRPGERYLFDPGIEQGFQNLGLKANIPQGFDGAVWYINGKEIARVSNDSGPPPEVFWPLEKGMVKIRLVGLKTDGGLSSDTVVIEVN